MWGLATALGSLDAGDEDSKHPSEVEHKTNIYVNHVFLRLLGKLKVAFLCCFLLYFKTRVASLVDWVASSSLADLVGSSNSFSSLGPSRAATGACASSVLQRAPQQGGPGTIGGSHQGIVGNCFSEFLLLDLSTLLWNGAAMFLLFRD